MNGLRVGVWVLGNHHGGTDSRYIQVFACVEGGSLRLDLVSTRPAQVTDLTDPYPSLQTMLVRLATAALGDMFACTNGIRLLAAGSRLVLTPRGRPIFNFIGWFISLSADGSSVAIGAIFNDGNGTYSGHVHKYRWVNGKWVKVGNGINGEAKQDCVGTSSSLSVDRLIVAIGGKFNN